MKIKKISKYLLIKTDFFNLWYLLLVSFGFGRFFGIFLVSFQDFMVSFYSEHLAALFVCFLKLFKIYSIWNIWSTTEERVNYGTKKSLSERLAFC